MFAEPDHRIAPASHARQSAMPWIGRAVRRTVVLALVVVLGPRVAAAATVLGEALAAIDAGTQGTLPAQTQRTLSQWPADDAAWPLAVFLRAELDRAQGARDEARRAYRELATWSAGDPLKDGWGGDPLTPIALWRWTRLVAAEPAPDPEEVKELARITLALLDSRFMQNVASSRSPDGMARIEEDLLRNLAQVEHKLGNQDLAQALFLDYLRVAYSTELTPAESEMLDGLVRSGVALDRIEILRAKRFLALGFFKKAEKLFTRLRTSEDREVRAEAGLYLADIFKTEGRSLESVIELLRDVAGSAGNPEIVQEALFDAGVSAKTAGDTAPAEAKRNQYYAESESLFNRITKEYPLGRRDPDALYQLAQLYQQLGRDDDALAAYSRLQAITRPHNWESSEYFRPAMLLYTRAAPGDLDHAIALLQTLTKKQPFGDLYLNAYFWLGRLSEEAGHGPDAERYFRKVVDLSPFDYHAVRARMHLNLGPAAANLLMPDPKTRAQLAQAAASNLAAPGEAQPSRYLQRLKAAIASGVYKQAWDATLRFQDRHPGVRLVELAPELLEEPGATGVLLLCAVREYARSARDRTTDPALRLRIDAMIERDAGDVPFAMELLFDATQPNDLQAALQRAGGYAKVAYAPVYVAEIEAAARKFHAPPELLYSVMLRESAFDPRALSARSGIGLFQFIPKTARSLRKRLGLGGELSYSALRSYLYDPENSIALGAAWFGSVLLPREHGNRLFALLEHHAGAPRVDNWRKTWEAEKRIDDVEFVVENTPVGATRVFLRRVVADMAVVDAMGLFGGRTR